MNQYEIIDAIGTFQGLAQGGLMNYFSILSAYLVVAYFVGSKLSRYQIVIVTGLYLVMQFFTTWGIFEFFNATRLLAETVDQAGWEPPPIKPIYIVGPLLVFGIIAGLKFMWDVRHPEKE